MSKKKASAKPRVPKMPMGGRGGQVRIRRDLEHDFALQHRQGTQNQSAFRHSVAKRSTTRRRQITWVKGLGPQLVFIGHALRPRFFASFSI